MIEHKVTIVNKLGLHARAAAKFVALATSFSSEVTLAKGSHQVDGKSMMSVLQLAASKGTEMTLIIQGADEHEALKALSNLIDIKFEEDE